MAFHKHGDYPYLSYKQFNRNKDNSDTLESFNKLQKPEVEEKVARLSLSKKTPLPSTLKDNLRIVMIGKTGQGKSATANTILGKKMFLDDFTAESVTNEAKRITELIDGRNISVMDTPGFRDTHYDEKHIMTELAKITKLYPDGVHAFIYVMNMADPRFTAEDKKVLDFIQLNLGGGFKRYCLLVLSHGKSLPEDETLDTYISKQMENGKATHTMPKRRCTEGVENPISIFLGELSWKVLAIDNSSSVPFERDDSRKRIITMIDKMRSYNPSDTYNNDMFERAQKERDELKLKGLKEGWDEAVMDIVEEIIAANPAISQKNLQAEVRSQLIIRSKKQALLLQDKERRLQMQEAKWERLEIENNKLTQQVRDIEKEHKGWFGRAIDAAAGTLGKILEAVITFLDE